MQDTVVMTGKEIKAWRKGFGLEQREVAYKMGVSPATLCRIEKEDRLVTDVQLARLKELWATLQPGSPVAKAAEESKKVVSAPRKPLPAVDALSTLGNIYPYKDHFVVPSQYYARWASEETKNVNQAIDRLQAQTRLEIEEDFFRLSNEESKDFVDITNCDITKKEISKGIILITKKAVNTLTHYFNDPNSIAKSKAINAGYTSIEQIIDSDLSSTDKMIIMGELCFKLAKLNKQRAIMGAQIESLSKNLQVTDDKANETQKELDALKQASRLTGDQIEVLEGQFRIKSSEYGHPCVRGLIQRHLKQVYLGGRASGNTFKDIPSRHFDDMLARTRSWIPTPADRESILKHRIKDGKEPEPIYQQPIFTQ